MKFGEWNIEIHKGSHSIKETNCNEKLYYIYVIDELKYSVYNWILNVNNMVPIMCYIIYYRHLHFLCIIFCIVTDNYILSSTNFPIFLPIIPHFPQMVKPLFPYSINFY